MSRANPTQNTPNPSTRWFEWDGAHGAVRYYDKATKKNISLGHDFTFLLLEELSAIVGFHERSKSNIRSNEVRDTRAEVFIVKADKGKIAIATGHYAGIRDKVIAAGGSYSASLYLGYKAVSGGPLEIGNMRLKGAALSVWMEFCKTNRDQLYKQAVRINGFTEGKKGNITFRTPKFEIKGISQQTEAEAIACSTRFDEYLKGYFARTKTEQVAPGHEPGDNPEDYPAGDEGGGIHHEEPEADDVPF